jgi:hypothetical protein
MEEWKIILLTGLVSIVSSIVTALITNSHTHRNEVKKLILEKRAALYFEFYDIAEQLLHQNYKVYDDAYISEILKFKPRMKLLSSKKTIERFKDFFELVVQKYEAFQSYRAENDPRISPKFFHTYVDENGVEQEEWHGSEFEIADYESHAEVFKTKNIPTKDELSKCIKDLYEQMREDLGSNI